MPEKKSKIKKVVLKRVSLTLFFCLLASSAFAADTVVYGRVVNRNTNLPINAATVKILNLAGATVASTTTNSSGDYRISRGLASGYYFIKCAASGYYNSQLSSYLRGGGSYVYNFSLSPIPTNNPPRITSFTPNNRSTFITGDTVRLSVTATDPDNNPLKYRFIWDNRIVQNWSSSTSFNYKTALSDRGRHRLRVYVIDTKGAQDTRSVDIYVYIAFPQPGR